MKRGNCWRLGVIPIAGLLAASCTSTSNPVEQVRRLDSCRELTAVQGRILDSLGDESGSVYVKASEDFESLAARLTDPKAKDIVQKLANDYSKAATPDTQMEGLMLATTDVVTASQILCQ